MTRENRRIDRRSVLIGGAAGLLATAGMSAGARRARAADAGEVVVSSWGGNFQAGQREAIFEPFTEATGIKVVEDTEPTPARIKAMVDAGQTQWDVGEVGPDGRILLERGGYLEDFEVSADVKASMAPHLVQRNGVGTLTYGQVIAYSTEAFTKEDHPGSWAEFWDVERYPGPRMLNAQDYVVPALEVALLADGVAREDLYPLDFERAYRSLDRIRPHIAKWSRQSAAPALALIAGEVTAALSPLGRLVTYKDEGAPVDLEWNESLVMYDYWVIPKNAPNYENAVRFIEFASQPEPQAAFAKLQLYGPTNTKAFDLIPEERAALLPGSPAIADKQIWVDFDFWAAIDEATGMSNVEKNVSIWNEWIKTG